MTVWEYLINFFALILEFVHIWSTNHCIIAYANMGQQQLRAALNSSANGSDNIVWAPESQEVRKLVYVSWKSPRGDHPPYIITHVLSYKKLTRPQKLFSWCVSAITATAAFCMMEISTMAKSKFKDAPQVRLPRRSLIVLIFKTARTVLPNAKMKFG
jgi:hypothetical protein